MLTNKVHVLACRESMEIDIKLYSTTIVNNNSAKQAVDKKKTRKTRQNVTNYK